MNLIFLFLDPYLIQFYRLTGRTELDFLVGTFVVALIALLLGEFTSSLASVIVRRPLDRVAEEAKKYHELSMEALKDGDRPAYEATNQVANEVFSKSFFMHIALSATFFWPVFFALAWMQYRFLEVGFPIPGTGWSVGYIGVFIIIYALAYFLMKQVKRLLRLFLSATVIPASESGHDGSVPLLPPGRRPDQRNV
jgi:hypothetical protein